MHDKKMSLVDDYYKYCCQIDETLLYKAPLIYRRAKDMYVWFDGDEIPYIDLVMGHSSINFGHCHERLVSKIQNAVSEVDHIHSMASETKILLSKQLVELQHNRKDEYQVYIGVGGANVVGNAIKLARNYSEKRIIVSFKGGFHGYEKSSILCTDEAFVFKENIYSQGNEENIQLPFCCLSECNFFNNGNCYAECLENIENILLENKDSIAAVIVEPIQGAAGFIVPRKMFLRGIQSICEENSIPFILDDIQMGLGRTGKMFSFEHFDISNPDIILLGKSLAGGYYPVSAIIAKKKFFESVIHSRSTFGCTFSNSTFGCAIALEVLKMIEEDNLLENCITVGNYLKSRFKSLMQLGFVKDVSGIGLAIGVKIEIEKDEHELNKYLAQRIVQEGLKHHLLLYSGGVLGNILKFSPKINLTKHEADLIFEKIDNVFNNINIH